ncbi:MAG: hypothetical protein KC505_10145 [Myxococcales bacterium]|nr:hypothetical protein [Myxococcales bacterium]
MILFLYAFYLSRSQKKRLLKNFQEKNTLILAHRGLQSKHLENTVEAFHAAFSIGVDGVEFDVQMSRDLIPVVFHDRSLKRLSGVENNIDQLSFDELSQLHLLSEKYSKHYRITKLEDVLRVLPDNKVINIELKETVLLKGEKSVKKVLDCILPHKNRLKIIVSSFDARILNCVAKQEKSLALGYLLDKKLTLISFLRSRFILDKIDFLHPHLELLNPQLSRKIKNMDLKLIPWGHKKIGKEAFIFHDGHFALISDACPELVQHYRR